MLGIFIYASSKLTYANVVPILFLYSFYVLYPSPQIKIFPLLILLHYI